MKVKLGDYIRIMHGFAFKTENYVDNSEYRLVTLGNFQEGGNCFKYNDSKATYYGAEFPDRFILSAGDLIMPLTEQVVGLFGNSALVPHENRFKFVLNQRVGKVEIIREGIDLYYLHYLLATTSVKYQLEARASGTKQRNISPDDVYDVIVDLPEYYIQKRIGKLLYDIELKQEFNNKISSELESMAKTLYDYWFLQFEFPNEEGKPYKSSGGKMVWNDELKREIPDGWKVDNLMESSLCEDIKSGVDYFETNKIYLPTANINGEEITDGDYITFNNRESRANMQPVKNSVWFAKMKNSIKHLSIPNNSEWFINKYILSTGFQGLKCSEDSFSFIHCVVNSSWFETYKDVLSHGATQESVNNEDLKNIKFAVPTNKVLKYFSKIVLPMLERKFTIVKENQELSSLRDFLLPLLMNGQVTFKDESNE